MDYLFRKHPGYLLSSYRFLMKKRHNNRSEAKQLKKMTKPNKEPQSIIWNCAQTKRNLQFENAQCPPRYDHPKVGPVFHFTTYCIATHLSYLHLSGPMPSERVLCWNLREDLGYVPTRLTIKYLQSNRYNQQNAGLAVKLVYT